MRAPAPREGGCGSQWLSPCVRRISFISLLNPLDRACMDRVTWASTHDHVGSGTTRLRGVR